MEQISERLVEVYAILSCLNEEEKKKIPEKLWKEIEKRKSQTYSYVYKIGDEQNLPDDTLAMLCDIYLKHLKS